VRIIERGRVGDSGRIITYRGRIANKGELFIFLGDYMFFNTRS
jgi:hypothetical protein